MKALPESIARWFPEAPVSLGTDGFGRSESREALRDFFEVDARFVTLGALSALADAGQIEHKVVKKAMQDLNIDSEKPNPVYRSSSARQDRNEYADRIQDARPGREYREWGRG